MNSLSRTNSIFPVNMSTLQSINSNNEGQTNECQSTLPLSEQNPADMKLAKYKKKFTKLSAFHQDSNFPNQEVVKTISKGGYGVVFKVKSHKDGRFQALKRSKVCKSQNYATKESQTMQKINKNKGSNLVTIQEQFFTEHDGEYYHNVIMEQQSNNLRSIMSKPEIFKKTQFLVSMMHQMANALASLHKMDLLHRDIKPDNYLLNVEDMIPKVALADFGLSKFKKTFDQFQFKIGTNDYMAPEQLLHLKMPKKDYFKIDVWALGISIIEIITGQDVCNMEGYQENIKRVENDNNVDVSTFSENPKRLVQGQMINQILSKFNNYENSFGTHIFKISLMNEEVLDEVEFYNETHLKQELNPIMNKFKAFLLANHHIGQALYEAVEKTVMVDQRKRCDIYEFRDNLGRILNSISIDNVI